MKNIVVLINELSEIEPVLEKGANEIVMGIKDYTFSAIKKHSIDDMRNHSVLMNRFYFPNEMDLLKQQLKDLKERNVNHIYFCDPSVYYYAKDLDLVNHLIYKPDTLTVSANDVAFWKERGIYTSSLSPLITEEETDKILDEAENVEVTIHGHILMSASKRQLLSSYFEDSHQPVQQEKVFYLKEMKREDLMPIYEDDLGTYIYSDFVLNSFEEITSFHTDRFFIDGIFLSTDELSDAVEAYRNILNGKDAQIEKENYQAKHANLKFSSGYYKEKTIK